MDVLEELSKVIESRKCASPDSSYVALLHAKDLEYVSGKVTEEAEELVAAAGRGIGRDMVYEAADLWFHSLVLLSRFGLTQTDVLSELQRRFGVSGIEEKKSRSRSGR